MACSPAHGTAWVLGSVVIGLLFDVSLGAVTAFAVAAQLAAIPFIVAVRRHTGDEGHRRVKGGDGARL